LKWKGTAFKQRLVGVKYNPIGRRKENIDFLPVKTSKALTKLTVALQLLKIFNIGIVIEEVIGKENVFRLIVGGVAVYRKPVMPASFREASFRDRLSSL
jgi:hypothetical protein